MYPDFNELLSVLNAKSVKYLIVGGYAVSIHSQPRATKDLDILVKPDPENAKALYLALAEFGAPLQGFTVADFEERGPFFQMGQAPLAVDILTEVPGIEFDEAWERRVVAFADPDVGLKANYISREDLLTAKMSAGRPQDLADVAAIRKTERDKRFD